MSKKIKTNIEKLVMKKVESNEIQMKPKWYFILGSILLGLGLTAFSIGAIFLSNLIIFLLRSHGPMREVRLALIINSFPYWIVIFAILGLSTGFVVLKKYDFSYKKNIYKLIILFILSIILAGYLIDFLGLSQIWFRRGPLRQNRISSTKSLVGLDQKQVEKY